MLTAINDEARKSYRLIREGKPDFLFIPGARYSHKRGGQYRIIGVGNTTATDPDYPPTVAYENIETGEFWTKGVERFADGMKLEIPVGPKHRFELISDDHFSDISPAVNKQWNNLELNWTVDSLGHGHLGLFIGNTGETTLQDEGMGKDFAKALFCRLIDQATISQK